MAGTDVSGNDMGAAMDSAMNPSAGQPTPSPINGDVTDPSVVGPSNAYTGEVPTSGVAAPEPLTGQPIPPTRGVPAGQISGPAPVPLPQRPWATILMGALAGLQGLQKQGRGGFAVGLGQGARAEVESQVRQQTLRFQSAEAAARVAQMHAEAQHYATMDAQTQQQLNLYKNVVDELHKQYSGDDDNKTPEGATVPGPGTPIAQFSAPNRADVNSQATATLNNIAKQSPDGRTIPNGLNMIQTIQPGADGHHGFTIMAPPQGENTPAWKNYVSDYFTVTGKSGFETAWNNGGVLPTSFAEGAKTLAELKVARKNLQQQAQDFFTSKTGGVIPVGGSGRSGLTQEDLIGLNDKGHFELQQMLDKWNNTEHPGLTPEKTAAISALLKSHVDNFDAMVKDTAKNLPTAADLARQRKEGEIAAESSPAGIQLKQTESDIQQRKAHALEAEKTYGYALDENGRTVFTRQDATENPNSKMTEFNPMSQADRNKDLSAITQLGDVQLNTSRYTKAAKAYQNVDALTRASDQTKLHDLLNKAGFWDFKITGDWGVDLPILSALSEGLSRQEKSASYNQLSKEGKDLFDGFVRTMSAIPAYQKALSGIGRVNKETLELELNNIANPSMAPEDILRKQREFQQNIDVASGRFPHNLPGTQNAPWVVRQQEEGVPERPPKVPFNYDWNPQGNGGKGSWQPQQE